MSGRAVFKPREYPENAQANGLYVLERYYLLLAICTYSGVCPVVSVPNRGVCPVLSRGVCPCKTPQNHRFLWKSTRGWQAMTHTASLGPACQELGRIRLETGSVDAFVPRCWTFSRRTGLSPLVDAAVIPRLRDRDLGEIYSTFPVVASPQSSRTAQISCTVSAT